MKKQKPFLTIHVGDWWFDHRELTLKHFKMPYYWVDAEELGEVEEVIDWVKHLSRKSGILSAQDLRDFVKLASLLGTLKESENKFQSYSERRLIPELGEALRQACVKMTRARLLSRKVNTLMKQRGIGPCLSLSEIEKLCDEAAKLLEVKQ